MALPPVYHKTCYTIASTSAASTDATYYYTTEEEASPKDLKGNAQILKAIQINTENHERQLYNMTLFMKEILSDIQSFHNSSAEIKLKKKIKKTIKKFKLHRFDNHYLSKEKISKMPTAPDTNTINILHRNL